MLSPMADTPRSFQEPLKQEILGDDDRCPLILEVTDWPGQLDEVSRHHALARRSALSAGAANRPIRASKPGGNGTVDPAPSIMGLA